MTLAALKIAEQFDRAAATYDNEAPLQEQVAKQLVQMAAPLLRQPSSLLDIGTGTGFVAANLQEIWPDAQITAVDQSPDMLRRAEQRTKHLRTIRADASTIEFTQKYDAIFSSMMLHWLDEPAEVLQRWQRWLKPGGKMFVALLMEGSFREWRDLCTQHNVSDGLWEMPKTGFIDLLPYHSKLQPITLTYPTARAFLQRLKATGTSTPRQDHQPVSTTAMRNLLKAQSQPFRVTYQVLYIWYSPQGSV